MEDAQYLNMIFLKNKYIKMVNTGGLVPILEVGLCITGLANSKKKLKICGIFSSLCY